MESQARKEGISNHEQKAVTKPQQSTETQGSQQNELRTRTESWHRVRKEEHEGESERGVSKAVLVKFGSQTNQKVKRQGNAPHFLAESKIPEAAAAEILEDYIML
jgi:hypothetical protein